MKDGMAEAISQMRNERELTQKQAAKRAGCSGAEWSKWERGRRNPGEEQVKKILKGLRCTEIELWDQKITIEQQHYRELAVKQGLPMPTQTSLVLAEKIDWLTNLDIRDCTQQQRSMLKRLQNIAVNFTGPLDDLFILVEDLYILWKNEKKTIP